MSFSNRRWVIVTDAEITSLPVDFNQLITTSYSTARKSLDGQYVLLKYEGTQPSFLNGKTEYTHSDILTILAGSDWTSTNES